MTCEECELATRPFFERFGAINFKCIACCLRWLKPMDAEAMRVNAPVIGLVSGPEFFDEVRKAWKAQPGAQLPAQRKEKS